MKLENDPFLKALTEELIQKHGCHTVVLYGSRARGDFTAESDYDLMGIRKSGKKYRHAEKRDGLYLDIFVYPEKALARITESHLYMSGAVVLYEKYKHGSDFVRKLKAAEEKKYKPLPDDEIAVTRVWHHKMLDRISRGDIEGLYRRSWLHEALLADYFHLRKKRSGARSKAFGGSKRTT